MRLRLILILLVLCPSLAHSGNLLPSYTTNIPADVYGTELITPVANRDFSSDTGYWSKGTNWVIDSGVASHSGLGGNLSAVIGWQPSTVYNVQYLVAGSTSGTVRPFGSAAIFGPVNSGNGLYSTTAQTAPSDNTSIYIVASDGFDGSIDDISIRPVTYAIGTKSIYSGGWVQNITGATISGDTAGVWSIVSGPGLNRKAYQIANTGSVNVIVVLTPTKAAVVGRSYRLLANFRQVSGTGTASFGLTGATATNISGSSFLPYVAVGKATNTTDKYTITVPPNCVIEFYEPKLLTSDGSTAFFQPLKMQ